MALVDSEDFDIRYSKVGDIETLRTWFKTEGMLHYYPPSNDNELENFLRIWIGFTRYSAALTATYQDAPVGMATLFLMPYRKVAHQAIFHIIVAPEMQRRGVGKALVRNLKHLAKTYFRLELLNVEILDNSGLIPLLKGLDFYEFARQEHYVKEGERYFPRVLMEAEL